MFLKASGSLMELPELYCPPAIKRGNGKFTILIDVFFGIKPSMNRGLQCHV
jgi:hypothetical protein